MSYTKVDYGGVESVRDGMHFLREPLETEKVGVTVVECEPGWTGPEHDHADQDHEEVYLLLEGEATVTIDGESVALESGDAVRVPAGATRQIETGDVESTFVLAGAS